ncbi:MAG: site-specific integrase [Ghiorsea sp.]
MSLIKRKGIWHIDFTFKGQRVCCSAKTKSKSQALELEAKLRDDIRGQAMLGNKPQYTWEDAVVRFIQETSHKADHEKDKQRLRWIMPFLSGKSLQNISSGMIKAVLEEKRKTASPATANRYLATIRAIMRKAAGEWEWIISCPTVKPYPEPQKRFRWLSKSEASNLLNDCSNSIKWIVLFAIATGLRERNVTMMEWSQVDMIKKIAWIHPDQAKTRKAIGVPLNDDALQALRMQVGKDDQYVFNHPRRMSDNTEWRKLCKQYKINFHTLRHTFASWHVQAGTSLATLKELGGWSSLTTVMRYSHLSTEHLAQYASNSCVNFAGEKVTNSSIKHHNTS